MIKGRIFFKNKSDLYSLKFIARYYFCNTISEENQIIINLENKNDKGFNLVISCGELRFTKWFNYRKPCDKFQYEGDLIMDILFHIRDDLKENGIIAFVYFPVENYPAKLNYFSL